MIVDTYPCDYDSLEEDDDFGMINLGATAAKTDDKPPKVSSPAPVVQQIVLTNGCLQVVQYLALEAVEGNFKDHVHGGAMSKVVLFWEVKQLSSPCAVM